MRNSCIFFFALCGVIALLAAPGMVSGNIAILSNEGGGAGPGWGAFVWVDGASSQLYTGEVFTWSGGPLPPNFSSNTPFNGQSNSLGNVPLSCNGDQLCALLTNYGTQINDMAMIGFGISRAWVISEPGYNPNNPPPIPVNGSLLSWMTGSAPSPPYKDPTLQKELWSGASYVYSGGTEGYQVIVVPEQFVTLAGYPGTYTPYTPQGPSWPGWDPSATSSSQQWTFYIENDTPVPIVLPMFLLGSGLMALAGMRRVINK